MKKRTGVLIHSRHLQALNWERIMWGVPPDLMGQLSKGVLTALEEEAEIVVLGCGLRSGINGEMESEFNRQYLLDNLRRLPEFAGFQGINLGRAEEIIRQILVLDMSSLSTIQEVAFAGKAFENAGMERVISVSSRTHAPRCLNEALRFYGRPGSKISVGNVLVYSSDVGWASNDDVVVFEPPHRPDDSFGDIRHELAKNILRDFPYR